MTLIELRTESGVKRNEKAERCDRKMDRGMRNAEILKHLKT